MSSISDTNALIEAGELVCADRKPKYRRKHRKTHCKYGHEFTAENTHFDDRGYRWCKMCWRRRSREIYARDPELARTKARNGRDSATQVERNRVYYAAYPEKKRAHSAVEYAIKTTMSARWMCAGCVHDAIRPSTKSRGLSMPSPKAHPTDTVGLIEEDALVCASHPSEPWPHGDCAEGMPKPWQPSEDESYAAEVVLSDAMGETPDRFWRAVVDAQLIAAHDA